MVTRAYDWARVTYLLVLSQTIKPTSAKPPSATIALAISVASITYILLV